mmetsp:Transcript_3570/g.10330  ORF Transcript_3570/g.10330 Transcript_3570/m.10330 type:complete len:214 (-) Transcript_3570:155-796(-)
MMGITEASTTLIPSRPKIFRSLSTTSPFSAAVPMRHVPTSALLEWIVLLIYSSTAAGANTSAPGKISPSSTDDMVPVDAIFRASSMPFFSVAMSLPSLSVKYPDSINGLSNGSSLFSDTCPLPAARAASTWNVTPLGHFRPSFLKLPNLVYVETPSGSSAIPGTNRICRSGRWPWAALVRTMAPRSHPVDVSGPLPNIIQLRSALFRILPRRL